MLTKALWFWLAAFRKKALVSVLQVLVNVAVEAKFLCLGDCKTTSLLSIRRKLKTISQLQLCRLNSYRILVDMLWQARANHICFCSYNS